jgi:hypothetical protein
MQNDGGDRLATFERTFFSNSQRQQLRLYTVLARQPRGFKSYTDLAQALHWTYTCTYARFARLRAELAEADDCTPANVNIRCRRRGKPLNVAEYRRVLLADSDTYQCCLAILAGQAVTLRALSTTLHLSRAVLSRKLASLEALWADYGLRRIPRKPRLAPASTARATFMTALTTWQTRGIAWGQALTPCAPQAEAYAQAITSHCLPSPYLLSACTHSLGLDRPPLTRPTVCWHLLWALDDPQHRLPAPLAQVVLDYRARRIRVPRSCLLGRQRSDRHPHHQWCHVVLTARRRARAVPQHSPVHVLGEGWR